jgi:hypothetical protein
MKAVQ